MSAREFEMLHCPQKMGWKRILFLLKWFISSGHVSFHTDMQLTSVPSHPAIASGSGTPVLPQLVDPVWAQSRHVQRQLLKMAPQITANHARPRALIKGASCNFPRWLMGPLCFFLPRSIRFVKARSSWGKGWGMSWDGTFRNHLWHSRQFWQQICHCSARRGEGGLPKMNLVTLKNMST